VLLVVDSSSRLMSHLLQFPSHAAAGPSQHTHSNESFTPTLCDVCNIMMSNKQVMEDHYKGKKHHAAMERLSGVQASP
jgi:hypothetical protein